MARHILLINGHPDPRVERLCHALCGAYQAGALAAGHEVRRLDLGALDFALIRTAEEFTDGRPNGLIAEAQEALLWCDQMVVVFPLWLGGPPALLKAWFEQVFRYGFAIPKPGQKARLGGLLGGRSARLVVTMGMPALIYRALFGAFGVRALERGVLWISGIRGVRRTLLGGVGRPRPLRGGLGLLTCGPWVRLGDRIVGA